MAAPQTHIAINLVLWQILSRLFKVLANTFSVFGITINIDFWVSVFIFGTILDFDHFLNLNYVKYRIWPALTGKDKHPEQYGDEFPSLPYFHSVFVLAGSLLASILLNHSIPFILFTLHQLVDFLEKSKDPQGHNLWFLWPLPLSKRRVKSPFYYTGKGTQEFIITSLIFAIYSLLITGIS